MIKQKDELVPVGKKIKKARLAKKVNLDLFAKETGLNKDYIKELEKGEQIPSVGTLLQISKILCLDSNFFLKNSDTNTKERARAYTKRTDNYVYSPLCLGDENKHLKAFHITVQAKQAHKGVGFKHEGEEFVYVLKGDVEVKVGDNINTLSNGDSLHFNSSIKHDLINIGKTDAELIVVVYSP